MLRGEQFWYSDLAPTESDKEIFVHPDGHYRAIKIDHLSVTPLEEKPLRLYSIEGEASTGNPLLRNFDERRYFDATTSSEFNESQKSTSRSISESILDSISPPIPSLATMYFYGKQRQVSDPLSPTCMQSENSNSDIFQSDSSAHNDTLTVVKKTLAPERLSSAFKPDSESLHAGFSPSSTQRERKWDHPHMHDLHVSQNNPCPLCGSTSGKVSSSKLVDFSNGIVLGSLRRMRALRQGEGALEKLHSILHEAKSSTDAINVM